MQNFLSGLILLVAASLTAACSSGSSDQKSERQTSSSSSSSTTSSGGMAGPSSSSSGASQPDTTPDPLIFEAAVQADFDVWVSFEPVTIAGVNAPVPVSITGGEYALDNGDFTDEPGTVADGQHLRVRVRSAAASLSESQAQLQLGSELSYVLSVTTKADSSAPSGRITFPAGNAMTPNAEISVSGVASDDDRVARVSINGHEATSSDGFQTWTVRVPVETGMNTLVLAVEDAAGNLHNNADSAELNRQAALDAPDGLAIDEDRNTVFAADFYTQTVYAVNLDSGDRSLVSGRGRGTGPELTRPDGLVLSGDGAFLYCADSSTKAVFRIEIASGNRSVVSGGEVGMGPALASMGAIALAQGGTELLVTERNRRELLSINLATGDRRVVSAGDKGEGPLFDLPRGVALASEGDSAYVVDAEGNAVYAVDLGTGNRTLLSGGETGLGPDLTAPAQIRVDGAQDRLLVADEHKLVAVDPRTGERSVVSDEDTGEGAALGITRNLDISASSRILISSGTYSNIVQVDPNTGDREVLTDKSGVYSGAWRKPIALAVDETGNELLVGDPWRRQVIKIDFESGETTMAVDGAVENFEPSINFTLIASDTSNNRLYVGQNLYAKVVEFDFAAQATRVIFDEQVNQEYLGLIGSLVVDPLQQRLFYRVRDASSVIEVDVSSGARSVVASPTVGYGAALHRPYDLFMDSENQRLFVVSDSGGSLIEIDLQDGGRSVVTSEYLGVGSGPEIPDPHHVAVDLVNERAWLITFTSDEIFEVDLGTGARTLISSGARNGWPKVDYSDDMVFSRSLQSVFVAAPNDEYVIQVDLLSGDRVAVFP